MSEQPDEASETVHASMRAAMSAAEKAAQLAMRMREQHQRDREAQSLQRTAELKARHDAERAAAAATLSPVNREQWWATAEPEQIAHMYETAHTWEDLDPNERAAATRIREQVHTRYGIDPSELSHADELHDQARAERAEAGRNEAAAVSIGADAAAERAERAEHQQAKTEYATATQGRSDALWDSSDRRIETAASLDGVASAEAINGRMLPDTGQGQPARAAVAASQPGSRGRAQSAASVAAKPQPQHQPQRRR